MGMARFVKAAVFWPFGQGEGLEPHVLWAIAQKDEDHGADDRRNRRLAEKRRRQRARMDDARRHGRDDERGHAAACRGDSHGRAHMVVKPASDERRHAYHAAQAVSRAGEDRPKAEERCGARLREDAEPHGGEQRGHEHAAPAVESGVVAVDEQHADKRGERAECQHDRAGGVAHHLDDVGLVHAKRRACKAHVDEQEQKAARADDLLVMSAYDLGHAHANTFWGAGPACVRPG